MFSSRIKKIIQVLLVILVLVAAAIVGVFFGYNYVISQNQRFSQLEKQMEQKQILITAETEGAIMLVIKSGDDTSDIAQSLFDKGLINNIFLFSIMSKLNGFDGGYLAGTHYLIESLSYDEIMYLLCQDPAVIKVTFPEGMTYQEIKQKLLDSGLQFDPEKLDEVMNNPNLFLDYKFIQQINGSPERDVLLSGYLFPDTYHFDINTSEEAIIESFLRNMEIKLYDEYYERAAKMGMTMDQVMTLASLIQSETTIPQDMIEISAVFHNRMKTTDASLKKLGSCATVNYLRLKENLPKIWYATESDITRYSDNPYNTYVFEGLPPGPICMPGSDAIEAALYPEVESRNYYFCATGVEGGTAFARNLSEQNANIAKYQENWT